ncbi:MAG: MmoB/DmpM family protein [Pseudonocardia sp.]
MENAVGPVLRMGDEVELVVAAIEDDNPDVDIEVTDRGSYVRIEAPDRLRVTQESLRRYLGPTFEIRSMETMLAAFSGRITTTSDEMIWEWGEARRQRLAQAGGER